MINDSVDGSTVGGPEVDVEDDRLDTDNIPCVLSLSVVFPPFTALFDLAEGSVAVIIGVSLLSLRRFS